MIFYGVLWCSIMFYHVLSCSIMFYHVLSCSIMTFDVLGCSRMFYDVISCSMMLYDVLWCSYVLRAFLVSFCRSLPPEFLIHAKHKVHDSKYFTHLKTCFWHICIQNMKKKKTEILHHILIASHLLFMFYLSLSCRS